MVKYKSNPETRRKLAKNCLKKQRRPDKFRAKYIPNVTLLVEPN